MCGQITLDGLSHTCCFREQKYEEKCRQYLAAKRGSSSDEPRVHFQDSQHTQDTYVASGHLPAIPGDVSFSGGNRDDSTHQQSYEQSRPSIDPPPHVEKQSKTGARARSKTQNPTRPPSSDRRQVPEQDSFGHHQSSTTTVAIQPNADYANQQRERMRADSSAAQRKTHTELLPSATSTIFPARGQSLRHAHEVATEGAEAAASSVVDRKAEYARQLLEQMAADREMKSAIETERKKTALPSSSSSVSHANGSQEDHPRGDGSERVGGPVKNAKEEYAQQLREQMAAKETAQRAAKRMGRESSSPNAGPSWIEGATEGREARRKRSNAEYADQLRAQIAAQKSSSQIEQSRIASWEQLPKDSFRQAGHMEEHQHQQEWPGGAGRMEDNRRAPEWRSRSGGQRSNEEEPSHRRFEGERTRTPFQGETNNALALER